MLEDSTDIQIPEFTLAEKPVTPPAPEVVPPKPAHPQFLQNIAANLGFSTAEMESVGTPELENVVSLATKFKQKQFEQQFQQPVAPVVTPPEPEVYDWGLDAEGKPLTEESVIPGLRGVKEIPALKKELAELRQQLAQERQAIQNKSRAQTIDEAFAGLGKDYKFLFGEGSITKFQRDDPEAVMRQSALAAVGVPETDPSFPARLRKVADNIRTRLAPVEQTNGTPPKNRIAPADYEEKNAVEEWNQGALATATQRKSPASPKTRFQEHLEEVRRERAALGQDPTPAGDQDDWLV